MALTITMIDDDCHITGDLELVYRVPDGEDSFCIATEGGAVVLGIWDGDGGTWDFEKAPCVKRNDDFELRYDSVEDQWHLRKFSELPLVCAWAVIGTGFAAAEDAHA